MQGFLTRQASAGPRRALPIIWGTAQFVVLVLAGLVPETTSDAGYSFWADADILSALVLGALSLLLTLQRRRPLVVLGIVVIVGAVMICTGHAFHGYILATAFAVFRLAHTGNRLRTILTTTGTGIVLGAAMAFQAVSSKDLSVLIGMIAVIAFAAASADAIHSRRAFIDSMTERARLAEETHKAEARRRVTEERHRFARELHDAAAHQIAVINLQAAAASTSLAGGRTDDTETALTSIRTAAQNVLSEISALLVVLRSDDTGAEEILPPVRGLTDLDDLLTEFEASGLKIEADIELPATVPGAVDLVAYKAVQEGLTNAHKHSADNQARLNISSRGNTLRIRVFNRIPTEKVTTLPGGHGLTGLRERIDSVHGTMTTSEIIGGFGLDIELPLHKDSL